MLARLVLSLRQWRRWLLLYLFIAACACLHAISWAEIRYRMPVGTALVPFGALAVAAAVDWMEGATKRKR